MIDMAILSAIMTADQQNKKAEAEAKAAEVQNNYNAMLEAREAAAIDTETRENARRQRTGSAAVASSQRAALGASGAALASGSPLALLAQSAADEEMKVHDIHYQGAREADSHRQRSTMYRYQAGVARASRPSSGDKLLNITTSAANGLMQGAQQGAQMAGMAGAMLRMV